MAACAQAESSGAGSIGKRRRQRKSGAESGFKRRRTQTKDVPPAEKKKKKKSKKTKKTTISSSLSTLNLLDQSLEDYDQVLSSACNDQLYLCSLPELRLVLKANGLQYSDLTKVLLSDLTKDYIETHFSILSNVLFQTRFSSFSSRDTIIAAALESPEVNEDVSALQWHEGARKGLIISPQTQSKEMQTSTVSLGGLVDASASEFSAALKCLQLPYTTRVSINLEEATTDLLELSVDDCYHPDMSLIEIQDSMPSHCQDDAPETSWYVSNELWLLHPQLEEPDTSLPLLGLKDDPITQSLLPSLSCEEQLSQSTTYPVGKAISEAEAQVVNSYSSSNHTSMAFTEAFDLKSKSEPSAAIEKILPFHTVQSHPVKNWGILSIPDKSSFHARTTRSHIVLEAETEQISELEEVSEVSELSSHSSGPLTSSEGESVQPCPPLSQFYPAVFTCETKCAADNFDNDDMAAVEGLQLNVFHNLLAGDDISIRELLHDTALEGSWPLVESVSVGVGVEETPSCNSYHTQEMQQDSSTSVMPNLEHVSFEAVMPVVQQAASARANSLGFLDLLANVSAAAAHSRSMKQDHDVTCHTVFKSCAKRLFMEDEAESHAGEKNDADDLETRTQIQ